MRRPVHSIVHRLPRRHILRRGHLRLAFGLALAIVAACGEDNPLLPVPDPEPDPDPPADITALTGCWHLASEIGQFFGNDEGCLAALDSVTKLLEVSAADSIFATIDSVSHLTFVPPYRGAGDFAGTTFSGRQGSVEAVYRHPSGECTLETTIDGDLFVEDGEAGERFRAFYTVHLRLTGGDCATNACAAFVTFEGSRRAVESCAPPPP